MIIMSILALFSELVKRASSLLLPPSYLPTGAHFHPELNPLIFFPPNILSVVIICHFLKLLFSLYNLYL
jgi:hypothetical protein